MSPLRIVDTPSSKRNLVNEIDKVVNSVNNMSLVPSIGRKAFLERIEFQNCCPQGKHRRALLTRLYNLRDRTDEAP